MINGYDGIASTIVVDGQYRRRGSVLPFPSMRRWLQWCLCLIPIALLWIMVVTIPEASGYVERAVDQLLRTKQCVRCDLRNADLRGKSLNRAKLTGAYLVGARLGGASLVRANLNGVHMAGADLAGANLERVNFAGADLSRVNLTRARLQGARLSRARLSGASLADANLRQARLEGAQLQGTNLRGAKWLSQQQLLKACGDMATALPEGLHLNNCADQTKLRLMPKN